MMSFKVFITTNIGKEAIDILYKKGFEIDLYDQIHPPSKEYIIQKLKKRFDAIITNLRDPIDADVISAGKDTLKIIAQNSAGIDNIDIQTASKYKIPVSNTQDVLTEAVAEFTLFMMGTMARKLYSSERLVRDGRWEGWHPYHPFLGMEVYDKTIGIIGTGKIGKAFIKKILSLDIDILMYSRTIDKEFEESAQDIMNSFHKGGFFKKKRSLRYTGFEDLIKNADIISIHTPLIKSENNSTYHMISKREFNMMKKGVCIINTSRGSIINEKDMIEAIKQNIVSMAGLDVFEKEPLPSDSPLLHKDLEERVRVFHHFASGGYNTRLSTDHNEGMAGRCIYSLIKILEGEKASDIPYIVNRDIFK